MQGDIKFHAEKSKNRYNEIMNLKRKITKLENQLQRTVNDCKQRDEVIDETIKVLEKADYEYDSRTTLINIIFDTKNILKKVKGDNK